MDEREHPARPAADAATTEPSDVAEGDLGGAPPLVTTVIPGRGLIDISGDALLVVSARDPEYEDDGEEDEYGDDDDGDDSDDDDLAILENIRDRIACEEGREWTEISATLESLTVAFEIVGVGGVGTGCLVRTIAWGLDDAEHHTTTWLPGVSLALLQRVPEGST